MPTDEEILKDAYYIRDLVNHSNKTKELAEALFSLQKTEVAITLHQMGLDQKERVKEIYDPQGRTVKEVEVVPFAERDFAKFSGIIEGLRWLSGQIDRYIKLANDEDARKAKEESKK